MPYVRLHLRVYRIFQRLRREHFIWAETWPQPWHIPRHSPVSQLLAGWERGDSRAPGASPSIARGLVQDLVTPSGHFLVALLAMLACPPSSIYMSWIFPLLPLCLLGKWRNWGSRKVRTFLAAELHFRTVCLRVPCILMSTFLHSFFLLTEPHPLEKAGLGTLPEFLESFLRCTFFSGASEIEHCVFSGVLIERMQLNKFLWCEGL